MSKPVKTDVVATEFSRLLTEKLKVNVKTEYSVLLFTHRQADPDALCAAFGLSQLLHGVSKLGQDEGTEIQDRGAADAKIVSRIVAPQGASTLGVSICKSLGISFEEEINTQDIESSDLIIAVDVGEKELLEPYLISISKSKAARILIDHHSRPFETKWMDSSSKLFESELVNSEATSTCEIVTLVFPEELLDETTSRVLLTGLMYDSQHLGLATYSTLEAVLKLMRAGAKIDEVREILKSRPDRSEVIARLKSAQRLQFQEMNGYLVAQTSVSSFHATVARMLIDIGSDVAIAYGEHGDEIRVSIRSTQRFLKETGIDFGKMLAEISTEMNMIGGGHPTAASMSGTAKETEVLDKILSKVRASLPHT